MQVFEYVIQRGDSLGQIAKKFTGNKDRWIEMLEVNPQIPRMRNQWGQKTFVPQRFQVGMRVFLPYGWIAGRGVVMGPEGTVSGAASGTVGGALEGQKCTVSPVTYHPTARYEVQGSEGPADIAIKFGRKNTEFHDLMGANSERPAGFVYNAWDQCVIADWYKIGGDLIRIPKKWLDVAPEFFPKDVLPYLKDVNGNPWTPPGPGPGPGTDKQPPPGGCVDPTPIWDPQQGLCVPKGTGGTGVSAKDEGIKTSTVLWVLLAAGAGIGGALLLNNLIKAKHVRGAPPGYPALPPAQVKEEVVVRR